MKKVIVIVDKQTTIDQMETIKEAILDPNRPCIVANELTVKQVINIDFDDAEVSKDNEIKMVVNNGNLQAALNGTPKTGRYE